MRYFVAANFDVVRNFADKQKLKPYEYTWVHDSTQLKGLRDIVLECLPGYTHLNCFLSCTV